MAGNKRLKMELQVLRALRNGPRHKNEIAREMLMDPCMPNPQLDKLLADLRVAGLVEQYSRGTYRIPDEMDICPHCGGTGLSRNKKASQVNI